MQLEQSAALFARASRVLVGGVNSPVRAFGNVGGTPICLARGRGPHVWDVDHNRYIDYVQGYGPLLFGHADPVVAEVVSQAARNGTTFGATIEAEVVLAERIRELAPSLDRVRFVSSGTEATMSALRLARGFTRRNKVLTFNGCYHGHADPFLVKDAGSGLATLGLPGSAGVTAGATADTMSVPYNDLAAAQRAVDERGDELAAIIVEPVACNMGLVAPAPGFLAGLRMLADATGAVLLFDEVITGFRLAPGGAQQALGIRADLVTYGKIIGGGLPVGAYGGREDIMRCLAPEGPVYQAGTLSGNPLAMAAGKAVLDRLDAALYDQLETRGQALQAGLEECIARRGAPIRLSRMGSLFHLWCCADATQAPQNYIDIRRADSTYYGKLFRHLLDGGIALAPSPYEVGFLSAAHDEEAVAHTVWQMDRALGKMAA